MCKVGCICKGCVPEEQQAQPMRPPHKHSALIKAWADCPSIGLQCRPPKNGKLDYPWTDMGSNEPVLWSNNLEYRIKPEPKPDRVVYSNTYTYGAGCFWSTESKARDEGDTSPRGMVKYVFDGETTKLKSVEIVK